MLNQKYDLGIIGGGLAGLSLGILQAKRDKKVVLFEKETYPLHRVCGEYISLESLPFLERLGVPVNQMDFPIIKNLQVTSPLGHSLEAVLPLGGVGISRYYLDAAMATLAKQNGVVVLENTKVTDVIENGTSKQIITAKNQNYECLDVVGAFGKRSNLDVKWDRPFLQKNRTSLNQYIGVKYHIAYDFPKNKIALHNFKDGYCGISAIEQDKYCLCYLTTKRNLVNAGNSIAEMERHILGKNPYLKDIFSNAKFYFEKPAVISQVSFEKKERVINQTLMLGDAGGLVAPLTGNGMSMAMLSAHITDLHFGDLRKIESEIAASLNTRLASGRWIQSLFGNTLTTEIAIGLLKKMPKLTQKIIGLTYGQKF